MPLACHWHVWQRLARLPVLFARPPAIPFAFEFCLNRFLVFVGLARADGKPSFGKVVKGVFQCVRV